MLAGNFFTGDFVKLRLADSHIVARGSIGEQRSLSGIAQFPGFTSAIAAQHARDRNNPYRDVIASSEAAFMVRDLDGAIENLDEDYVLYDIRDDGAQARMRGQGQRSRHPRRVFHPKHQLGGFRGGAADLDREHPGAGGIRFLCNA